MDALPSPLPEIKLQAMNWPASHYFHDIAHADSEPRFDFTAPYQRDSLWSLEQRQNLIKSLTTGIPVGAVILALQPFAEGRAYYRVVDGEQRIEAVRAFAAGDFTVPGHWFSADELRGGERARHGDVTYADLTRGRLDGAQIPGLEFDPFKYVVEHPDYDPSKKRDDKTNPRYQWLTRTEEEALQAEADLYLLVNFGGVEQTEEDRARATALGSGS